MTRTIPTRALALLAAFALSVPSAAWAAENDYGDVTGEPCPYEELPAPYSSGLWKWQYSVLEAVWEWGGNRPEWARKKPGAPLPPAEEPLLPPEGPPPPPAEAAKPASAPQHQYKSWGALHKYLGCFPGEKTKYDEDKDRRLIEISARHYGLPPALLFCLTLMESRFVDDAGSHAGAIGATQFMFDTWQGLPGARAPVTPEEDKNCREARPTPKNLAYCAAVRRRGKNGEHWEKLLQKLRKERLLAGELPHKRRNRVAAMANAAFYLSDVARMVRDHYDFKDGARETESLMLAMAAYNAGIGYVLGVARNAGQDIHAAIAGVRKEETVNYMKGTWHCMTAGDATAPYAGDQRAIDNENERRRQVNKLIENENKRIDEEARRPASKPVRQKRKKLELIPPCNLEEEDVS